MQASDLKKGKQFDWSRRMRQIVRNRHAIFLLLSGVLSLLFFVERLAAGDTLSLQIGLTHGPLVGAVRPRAAKVWVRTNDPAQVHIEYSTSADFASSLLSEAVPTTAEGDLTGQVGLSMLTPNTTYFYRLWANKTLLPAVYQFRTSPQNATQRTFAFAVLSDFKLGPAPVYATVAQDNPSLVIFLGDLNHSDPFTLDEMRDMHRAMRGSETAAGQDFIGHIRQFPFYHVWDDHDFGINEADKTFPGKQDALRAFREYFPTPSLPSEDGIWHRFRYAQAEFFMLDLRSQRDPNSTPDDPHKSILGTEQKAWLKDNLLQSTARWKFLMSTVPFNPTSKPSDSWGAFQTERAEIVDFIQQHGITGVIVISGDLHTGGALDNGSNSGFPELSVPHANIPVCSKGAPCRCSTAPRYPGIWSEGILCGTDNPGYGFVTVTPNIVILQVKGTDGTVRVSLDLQ